MECSCVCRKGGRGRLLKPQDMVHGSPSSPLPWLPVDTRDTIDTSCYPKYYVTATVSMLTNHIGL